MNELHTILEEHHSRREDLAHSKQHVVAPTSEIPDLFFDKILVKDRLNRIDILLLMYFYRIVWCRPNLYKKYGLTPVLSHSSITAVLELTTDELLNAIRRLESFQLLETIRSGQYFVRKYFKEEYDKEYSVSYDDF